MKNMVFSSVGDNTLFDQIWAGKEQNYDIYVVYYGDNDAHYEKYKKVATWIERRKGSKFQNFYYFYHNYKALVEKYSRFFILDDDIQFEEGGSYKTSVLSINKMFEISREYNLDICGPSFTKDGIISHQITKHRPNVKLAYTNFVEVNVPLFSLEALNSLMQWLTPDLIGWGIDYLAMWANDKERKSAYAIIHQVKCKNPFPNGVRELKLVKNCNKRAQIWKNYAKKINCPYQFVHVTHATVPI